MSDSTGRSKTRYEEAEHVTEKARHDRELSPTAGRRSLRSSRSRSRTRSRSDRWERSRPEKRKKSKRDKKRRKNKDRPPVDKKKKKRKKSKDTTKHRSRSHSDSSDISGYYSSDSGSSGGELKRSAITGERIRLKDAQNKSERESRQALLHYYNAMA